MNSALLSALKRLKEKNKLPTLDEQLRAPKGGVNIKGKFFKGGQFIPTEGGYAEEYKRMLKERENKVEKEKSEKSKTSASPQSSKEFSHRKVVQIMQGFRERSPAQNKTNVVMNLWEEIGGDIDQINAMVRNWAATSADEHPESIGLQMVAKDIFGAGSTNHLKTKLGKKGEEKEKFIKSVYKRTQDWFKKQGYSPDDEIVLYRGVKGKINAEKYALQPLSSFSLTPTVAESFSEGSSGTTFVAKVPVKNIFSTPLTGIGCTDEFEIVVIGHPININLIENVFVNSAKDFKKIVEFSNVQIGPEMSSLEGSPKYVGGYFRSKGNPFLKSLKGAPKYVGGKFDCSGCENLTSLKGSPEYVGGFSCYYNQELISLKGAPKQVGLSFDCSRCENLISLKGSPEHVGGNFDCSECENLTSLEGSPEYVGGNFDCYYNQELISLEGAPKQVGLSFDCSRCENLISLEGAPKQVGRSFICTGCENLTSLEGSPEHVGGDFDCNGCENLTSLEGAPKQVGRSFDCNGCENLTSLEGAPKQVGRSFICTGCENLTSLEGSPEHVGGGFDCSECENLISLKGAPKQVNGNFYCDKRFTEEDVRKVCNVKGDVVIV